MLVFISTILLIICLVVISLIIIKKFPALAILDVENIPGKKEAKFKEEIIKKRLERDLAKWGIVFLKIWNFANHFISNSLHKALEKLIAVKEAYRKNKKLTLAQRRERIKELFRVASDSVKDDNLEQAENSLIEIISLDQRRLPAFIELADVYTKGKKWAEAKQTLGYALKLIKANKNDEFFLGDISLPEIYFSLSWVCDNLGDKRAALDNIREALEFEANNPRYLDYAIELAIAEQDKKFALSTLGRLQEVNPDNAKLVDWETEINELGGSEEATKEAEKEVLPN